MKKIISIIIAIIVIIAAALGIAYFTTDLFKTPEQLFFRHYAQNMGLLGKQSYTETIESLKKAEESSYVLNGEITAKVETSNEHNKELAEVLGKGKITYTTQNDGQNKKSKADVTLNYDNKDIVTLNAIQNNEQYGIKITDLYDKYVSVENNNLKALFTKLGLDATNVPDKIETLDVYEFLTIDKEVEKHIKNTYSKILTDNVSADSYSVEKDVTIKYNNADMNANAYKLTITEEQLKTMLTKLYETLKADDITLDLVVEKYNKMAAIDNAEAITKQDLINMLEKELEEANNISANSDKAIEIITYTTKEGLGRIEILIQDLKTMTIDLSKKDKTNLIEMNITDKEDVIKLVVGYTEKDVNATVGIESQGDKIEILLKQTMAENQEVSIEDFTKENSEKLNDMSTQEINTLLQKLYTNLMKVLPQKMQLLGINTQVPTTNSTMPT